MTEIIDNNKISSRIKDILVEKNSTPDDLAKSLGLRKSAINSNLSGKTSFDYVTIQKISDLYQIPLQDVMCQINSDSTLISEYESFASTNFKEFKKKDFTIYSIASKDIFGKVLVEYAIAYENIEMIKFIVDKKLSIVEPFNENSRTILLTFIRFLLKNKIKNVVDYMKEYAQINRGFDSDDPIIDEIFVLLDKDNVLLQTIFNESLYFTNRPLFKHLHNLVSNKTLIKRIAKNYLDNTFAFYCKNSEVLLNSVDLIEEFSRTHFFSGLEKLLSTLTEKEVRFISKDKRAIHFLIETQDIGIIMKYIEKGFISSINEMINEAIHLNYFEISSFLIEHNSGIDYRNIGYHAVKDNRINVINLFVDKMSQDNLDFFLSICNEKNKDMILFLTSHHAQINIQYMNTKTILKANSLIEELLNKGEDLHD